MVELLWQNSWDVSVFTSNIFFQEKILSHEIHGYHNMFWYCLGWWTLYRWMSMTVTKPIIIFTMLCLSKRNTTSPQSILFNNLWNVKRSMGDGVMILTKMGELKSGPDDSVCLKYQVFLVVVNKSHPKICLLLPNHCHSDILCLWWLNRTLPFDINADCIMNLPVCYCQDWNGKLNSVTSSSHWMKRPELKSSCDEINRCAKT